MLLIKVWSSFGRLFLGWVYLFRTMGYGWCRESAGNGLQRYPKEDWSVDLLIYNLVANHHHHHHNNNNKKKGYVNTNHTGARTALLSPAEHPLRLKQWDLVASEQISMGHPVNACPVPRLWHMYWLHDSWGDSCCSSSHPYSWPSTMKDKARNFPSPIIILHT